MKNVWLGSWIVVITLACLSDASSQQVNIERSFDQRKASYKLERFHEVDEPEPGSQYVRRFDYLYYSDAGQIAKIRTIESESKAGKVTTIKVDDYFFQKGELRLVRLYFFMSGERFAALKDGSAVPLLTGEHIELENGELTKWIALGKNIPRTDRRWADKLASVNVSSRIELSKYEAFKNSK